MGDGLKEAFLNPPAEFSPLPFWFWNDALDRTEILRQMAGFRSKGVMGVVIHPRIGLPRDIGYLSEAYMDLVEAAVEEAAATGMVIYLYDEGMYPSGSAHGMVVEGHPELASRGLQKVERRVQGPLEVRLALEAGENLVSAQAVRWLNPDQIDSSGGQVLAVEDGWVRFLPPDGGAWSVMLFVETFTRGVIRGIHFGEDDWEADPPPAADLLNPAATARFIQLTHERYYRRLKRHFGRGIQAIFTDEPSILGRRSLPGLQPWTGGFLEVYTAAGGSEMDLPALWCNVGPETEAVRRRYRRAVRQRMAEAYYRPLSTWCATHGVALTGHPAESDEIGMLRYFHIPGQDQVLRWVAPEDEKGLVGPHSTLAKCSSDAARHAGRRRNVVECFGACSRPGSGWNLTGADLKWMMDWLFVRGVNGLIPHAFYYSIRGPRRSGERPPDVGPNNIWWPDYASMVRYIERLSWLMTDSVNATPLAVLAENDRLPWALAKPLFQHQIEFNYLEEDLLLSADCRIEAGEIRIAQQRYRVVLVDEPERLAGPLAGRLRAFLDAGGQVLIFDPGGAPVDLPGVRQAVTPEALLEGMADLLSPDASLVPANQDLRISHVIKGGCHFYLLINEGEAAVNGELRLGVQGQVDAWDAWRGEMVDDCPVETAPDGRLAYPLQLERRESLIVRVDPSRPPRNGKTFADQRTALASLTEGWTVRGGPTPVSIERLESWTCWTGWEHFSGTVLYSVSFELPELPAGSGLMLDLGEVGELARVRVNGQDAGYRWWAPYRFRLEALEGPGKITIEIEVTNSLANRMDEAGLSSGLIGPVVVERAIRKENVTNMERPSFH